MRQARWANSPMDTRSAQLLDAARADPEAFAGIVDATKGMVYAIAYGFFRDRLIAEDVAQEAYLALFRNLDKLQSDLHVKNWLRQTTTRKCIDYSRRKRHQPFVALESVAEPRTAPREPDPFLADELGRRVAELPPKMRMVVILRFQEDLKLREIAETLSMNVNTVKTQLRRALIRLRPKVAHLRQEVSYVPAAR